MRPLLAVLALAFALPAAAQGVQRPSAPTEDLLLTRHVSAALSSTNYNGVILPARAFRVAAITTRLTVAGAGTGTCTIRLTDGSNVCDCVGTCATTGTAGWGDVGNKRIACSGSCSYAAGTSLILAVVAGCGTTQPTPISLDVRGYWQ